MFSSLIENISKRTLNILEIIHSIVVDGSYSIVVDGSYSNVDGIQDLLDDSHNINVVLLVGSSMNQEHLSN